MRTPINVNVKVYSRPELVMGEPTGRTQYVCETDLPFNPFMAVLGRAHSRDAAIADWKFRASHESYAKQYDLTVVVK